MARDRRTRSYTRQDLNYPEHLPVTGERDQILAALEENQVIIVAKRDRLGKDDTAA
ncbi:hypothetical protein [Nesterenkonia pannonica]|uniref:hypothetical protein n=1 Tax=Nesterenkonia pannonica TaxID=1548602 RepID=UPI00216450D7|nr:hypothetical protein [Nesterenkonia pannonica]